MGRPARTYIQQLCEDTGCNPEDLPEWMIGRNGGRRSGISAQAARHDDDDDDDDIYTNFINHNRHFMSIYFLLDPFEFPYYFYRIRGELIYVLSIIVYIPSTFCPTLGHYQY